MQEYLQLLLTRDALEIAVLVILLLLDVFYFFRIKRIENSKVIKDHLHEKRTIKRIKKEQQN